MKTTVTAVLVSVISLGVEAQLPRFEIVSEFSPPNHFGGIAFDGTGGIVVTRGLALERHRPDGGIDTLDLSRGRGTYPSFAGMAGDFVITYDVTTGLLTRLGLDGSVLPIDARDPDEVLITAKVSSRGTVAAGDWSIPDQPFAGIVVRNGQHSVLPGGQVFVLGFDGQDRLLAYQSDARRLGWYEDTDFVPIPDEAGLRFQGTNAVNALDGDIAIAGYVRVDGEREFYGQHLEGDAARDLVEPENANTVRPDASIRGVTSNGWVFGNVSVMAEPFSVFDVQPTLWVDQLPYDINDLLASSTGVRFRNVYWSDDTGQIIAEGYQANGDDGIYLLRPIPSPGTASVAVVLGVLASRRRRLS